MARWPPAAFVPVEHLTGQRSGTIRFLSQIRIRGDQLEVRLNPLERMMALRSHVSVPLSAVQKVSVATTPLSPPSILDEVKMGFAARTAPHADVATVGPRATYQGGRALIVVWLNRRSVVVHLAPNMTPWRLLVVSVADPEEVAGLVRTAAGQR